MKFPENSPAAFFRLLEQQKETQLLLAGIRLDVFSLLDEPQTASAAAALLHTDARNTEYFLKALTAIGIPLGIAKVLGDGAIYVASYVAQRRLVFTERG